MLEHVVDHVVEVSEGVTDDDNILFARAKSNPGNQMPNMAKSLYSELHRSASWMWLPHHKNAQLCVGQGGAESFISVMIIKLCLTFTSGLEV